MRHPEILDVALYAGKDLGLWRGFLVGRHVRNCSNCQREVETFQHSRNTLREGFDPAPGGKEWDRLGAEMAANIRLGLEAGECVTPMPVPRLERDGWKAALALATIFVLMLGGWAVRQYSGWFSSVNVKYARKFNDEMVLKATLGGIGVEQNGRAMALTYERGAVATVSVGLQGSMNARYVDDDTGQVTIHNVYTE
jgi:hypothetical protein